MTWQPCDCAEAVFPRELLAQSVASPRELDAESIWQLSTGISAAFDWGQQVVDHGELLRRRSEPVTPFRCSSPGCNRIVSVPHPLPDLSSVRCSPDRAESDAAA